MQLKVAMMMGRNYQQSSEKNLEGKQTESNEHEQNWIEKFLVTACVWSNSGQHFHENMFFKKKKISEAGLCKLRHRDTGVV